MARKKKCMLGQFVREIPETTDSNENMAVDENVGSKDIDRALICATQEQAVRKQLSQT